MDNFMYELCNECAGESAIINCKDCPHNIGMDPNKSSGHIAGPCGQQNCWYGCVVCRYNNGINFKRVTKEDK